MRKFDRSRKNREILTTFAVGGAGVVLIQFYLRPIVQGLTGAKAK
jgi:hypothetical protein